MSSYTPGPWREYAPDIQDVGVDKNYRTIAAGCEYLKVQSGFAITGFVSPADARLIAAAPDLLEALQSLLLECVVAKENSSYATCQIAKIAIDDARQAIAKATGDA
jgi:hypothetical protein